MRRRRKHLEVSTFPFLAVLLCTMGSLILVLLVMDRKAKLAARQKAEAEVARVVEEARRQAEERRAARRRQQVEALAAADRRRQGQHDRLLADDQELQEQIRLLSLRLAEAIQAVRDGTERLAKLRKQVEAERVQGLELEQALRQDRDTAAASAAADTEAAKAAVRAAIADVAKLQSQLEELKAARGRKERTYSVVPFRGKNGDDRRPLYVECTSTGVIFYPGRKELPLPLHMADVRAEVDRHVARTTDAVRPAAADDSRPAYCLLLVRPAGIGSYYEMQVVLHGLRVDFGYEFIDADWLLDFPEDDKTPSRTWIATAVDGPGLPPAPPATGPRVTGLPAAASASGSPPPSVFPLPLASVGEPAPGRPGEKTGAPDPGRQSSEPVRGYRFSKGDSWPGGPAVAMGERPGNGPPLGLPSFPWAASPSGGLNGSVDGAFTPGVAVGAFGDASPERGPSNGPGGQESRSPPGFGRTAAAAVSDHRDTGGPDLPGEQGTGGTPGTPSGSRGKPGVQAPDPARQLSAPDSPTGDRAAATPEADNVRQGGVPNPGPNTPGKPAAPGDSETSARDAAQRGTTTSQPRTPGGSSAASTPRVPLPTDRFRPEPKGNADREPPLRRPARLSERDWIIYLECLADRVILYPARTEFPLAAVTAPPETNTLLAAVRKMIDRRQATLAPGDVPYRPEIRFLLRPDSLRVFHSTYPIFDALPVPKTRQNIAAEDDVRSVMQ
jgi:hypothetical protein